MQSRSSGNADRRLAIPAASVRQRLPLASGPPNPIANERVLHSVPSAPQILKLKLEEPSLPLLFRFDPLFSPR